MYSGTPDDPPSKFLSTSYVEIHERQLALDLGVSVPTEGVLRLAIETDATGRASEITVVELDEAKNITGIYSIPFNQVEQEAGSDRATPMQVPAVDLDAPSIEPLAVSEPKPHQKPKAKNE